jgi:hypothetical protein
MTDVFISYKKEDASRVEPIIRALGEAGYEVWWDHRIPAGRTYRDVIGAALQRAKCVIVVWSNLSVNAQWVLDEADEGMRRKVLLPLLIDDVDVPFGFRQIEAARLTGWSGDPSDGEWQNALSAVQHFVGGVTADPPKQQRSPQEKQAVGKSSGEAGLPRRTIPMGPIWGLLIVLLVAGGAYFAWHDSGGIATTAVPSNSISANTSESAPSTSVQHDEGSGRLSNSNQETPKTTPDPAPHAIAPKVIPEEILQVPKLVTKPVRRKPTFACYWLSNDANPTWRPIPHLATQQQCFAQDSCDGGLGHSGGGCYKWAEGPDAPRQPW